MNAVRPRKWLYAALIILAGGAARLPLEHQFSTGLRQQGLAEEHLNLSMRDELGQSFFIAVLGGFRSLVASLVELGNLDAIRDQNYAKLDAAYTLCTRLQPKEYHYWNFRASMKANNAFEYYKYEDRTRPGLQPWLRQNLINDALAVLKEARQYLPRDYRIPRDIANLTADFDKNQFASHLAASEWYQKAWELRPSLSYLKRFYIYQLAQSPGHEAEAWPLLMELYNTGPGMDERSQRTNTVKTLMVSIIGKVKAVNPEVELPPELAAEAVQILAERQRRLDAENRRRQKEAQDLKEMEEALMKQKKL